MNSVNHTAAKSFSVIPGCEGIALENLSEKIISCILNKSIINIICNVIISLALNPIFGSLNIKDIHYLNQSLETCL